MVDHGGIVSEHCGEDNMYPLRESDLVQDAVIVKGEVALSKVD